MQCIWPKIRVPDLSLMYQYVFPSLVCSPLFSCGSCKILLWVFILLDILMDLHNRPHSEENLNTLKQCYGTHTTATLPDHLTIFFFKIPFVDTWAALSGRKWKWAVLRTIQVFPNLQMTIWHPQYVMSLVPKGTRDMTYWWMSNGHLEIWEHLNSP